MQKRIHLFFILLFLLIHITILSAQIHSVHYFEPVFITGSRIPTEFSNSSRNITVIDKNDIEQQNAVSIEDLLQNITDLEFKTRGPLGVQSDVSIRGASSEQTLVMIDGMKISDPQTAHHSMNIPVNLEDISQIEILKGNASKIYGPNALGGVINIITQKSEKTNGSVNISGGENGFREGRISFTHLINNFSNHLSLSQKNSDGYIKNTDFDIRNIFYKTGLKTPWAKYNFNIGYQRKDFGANRFYTLSETERETTEQFLANINTFIPIKSGHFSIKISGRRNFDHFQIPEYSYINKHTTQMYSTEINGFLEIGKYIWNFGSDFNYSEISGMRMNHNRTYFGVFGETVFNATEKLTLSPGISSYNYKEWGLQFFPGIDIGFQLMEKISIFSSIGSSFRVPSFTDLFYSGVANMGNAELRPEKAISYEIGGKYISEKFQSSITVFHRNTSDKIEYVKDAKDPNSKFVASNLSDYKVNGIEASLKLFAPMKLINSINLSYSYFDNDYSYNKYAFKHRYLLNSIKHNYSIVIEQNLLLKTKILWNINYQERIHDNGNGRMLTNLQINLPVNQLILNANISNLFNEKYNNFMDVPMPGRLLKMGITYKF